MRNTGLASRTRPGIATRWPLAALLLAAACSGSGTVAGDTPPDAGVDDVPDAVLADGLPADAGLPDPGLNDGATSDPGTTDPGTALDVPPIPDVPPVEVVGLGGRCVRVRAGERWLAAPSATTFAFGGEADAATRFFLQPSDLSTYLLYDPEGGYLLAEDGPLLRATVIESDVSRVEDGYISGAEWIFEPHPMNPGLFQLRHRRTDRLLGEDGLATEGAVLTLETAEGCTPYPELSVDATGAPKRTTFDDGTLYGIADIHEHILTNLSFGGGIYHGAPFHRLGVPHALPDCSVVHGPEGRKDIFGYVTDVSGIGGDGLMKLLGAFADKQLPEKNHDTAGWPDFTAWPNARKLATHQTMYYRWIERAWLAGMRLMVQHATSDYVICGLMVGGGINPSRYDCEDMTAIDRILDETWAMQRYIDAQWGGEGKGWFRIVTSPAEARAVIAEGKLAVVLGIETSNPFKCYLTPRPGGPTCDEAWVDAQLDAYHARGVRAVFPVHKFDNRFSPGDGSRGFLQVGNFILSGHWLNYTQECSTDDMPTGWDDGPVTYGGLLQARDEYLSDPPVDMSGYVDDPIATLFPYLDQITAGPAEGNWCQKATITPIGEALISGLMDRGMIIEIDHFPQKSYRRAYEILEANDYPGVGSHARHWNGRLFATGGVSNYWMGRCQDPDNPGSTVKGLTDRAALIESKGGYPGVPVGFDFNGIAGGPGPRFADGACGKPQPNPITYPFTSLDGGVEFTTPRLGNRTVDFNQEGMIHVGLLPELIQDARADAPDDAALDPLFRSAEAYVRMWEKAEKRAAERKAAK